MILKNISVLYGNELKLIESTNVQIKNEKFQKISKNISSKEKSIDCSNLLLIPGFVNSHTHIADSIGKDLSINADVDSKIHPMFGLKQKLLKETPKSSLSKYIKKSAKSMIKKGITTFIEVILNQELGEPFRRDAMKKPVKVAGINKNDMKPQKSFS